MNLECYWPYDEKEQDSKRNGARPELEPEPEPENIETAIARKIEKKKIRGKIGKIRKNRKNRNLRNREKKKKKIRKDYLGFF